MFQTGRSHQVRVGEISTIPGWRPPTNIIGGIGNTKSLMFNQAWTEYIEVPRKSEFEWNLQYDDITKKRIRGEEKKVKCN